MVCFVEKHPSSAYYNDLLNDIHGDKCELLSTGEHFSFTVLDILFSWKYLK